MKVARWPFGFLLVVALSAVAQALLWRWNAPAAECYVLDGKCVYQVSSQSSPYFVRDLLFAGFGIGLGLIVGALFAQRLWRAGNLAQLFAVVSTIGASYLAAKFGATSSIQLLSETTGIDLLSLHTKAFLLAFPMALQFSVLIVSRFKD